MKKIFASLVAICMFAVSANAMYDRVSKNYKKDRTGERCSPKKPVPKGYKCIDNTLFRW